MTHFKLSPKQKAARVFSYLFMALCVLVALFPIVWVVLSSFKTNREILSNGLQLPSTFSFSGYKQALEMAPILKFFVNSLIVSFASTALNVFILAMAGYVFAKKKFRFKKSHIRDPVPFHGDPIHRAHESENPSRNSSACFAFRSSWYSAFHNKLVQAGMTQSMSRVAHCIDNGPMEGFWGILKRERYYGRRFTGKQELVQMIETYIHYYNTRRVQRNLGVLTPMEKHALASPHKKRPAALGC